MSGLRFGKALAPEIPMSSFLLGTTFATIAAISWSVGAILARLGMQRLGSVTGTFIALVTGTVVVTTLTVSIQAEALLAISQRTLVWCLLLGVLQFPVARFLNYSGIRLAGVTPATSITGTNPLFAALLALVFLGERLTGLLLLGMLSVVAGVILVTTERTAQERGVGTLPEDGPSPPKTASGVDGWLGRRGLVMLGLLCSLGSSIAYGGVQTLARHLLTAGTPAGVMATYTLVFGTLFLLMVATRRIGNEIKTPGPGLLLMGAAGVCSASGTLFIYSALAQVSVTVAATIGASYPIGTLLLTHLFLQRLEKVTPRMALGTALTVLGVACVVLG